LIIILRRIDKQGHANVLVSSQLGQSTNAQYMRIKVRDFSGRNGLPRTSSSA
jgi:hypothetical protein